MKKLLVISAGLSDPSTTRMLADRIATAVEERAREHQQAIEVEHVEIREYINDLAQVMSTGMPTQKLRNLQDQVSESDSMIAATPVFSASYSGVFKMFFDALDPQAINGMPVIIAATAGTPRHSLALDYAMRPLFTYLHATVMPTGVFAATEDFGSSSGLTRRIRRAAAELVTYLADDFDELDGSGGHGNDEAARQTSPRRVYGSAGTDIGPARSSGTNVDMNVPNFADLLQGHDGNHKGKRDE